MRGDQFAVMVIFIGIPWILGWIYRTHLSHKRVMKVLELKAEMNSRLLDRLGSDPAAVEFLKSDAQQQMFDVKLPEVTPAAPVPYSRMLTAVQVSLLLLSGGVAFLWVRAYMQPWDQSGFLFFGTLAVALGVGSLLSAFAAFAAARFWHGMKT